MELTYVAPLVSTLRQEDKIKGGLIYKAYRSATGQV